MLIFKLKRKDLTSRFIIYGFEEEFAYIDDDTSKPHNYILLNVQERQTTHHYPFSF